MPRRSSKAQSQQAVRPPRTRESSARGTSAREVENEVPPAALLLDALRALRRELGVLERDEAGGMGLPPAQAQVLRELADRPADTLAELAERTHTDPSSVSVVVQRLVDAGLVARTVASYDRRRTELALTRAGQARLRRTGTPAERRLAAAIAALGPGRGTMLARSLQQLVASLRAPSYDDTAP